MLLNIIKTAILLLRIDDIVSGAKKASTLTEKSDASGQSGKSKDEDGEGAAGKEE
jgi:hypothetical protein